MTPGPLPAPGREPCVSQLNRQHRPGTERLSPHLLTDNDSTNRMATSKLDAEKSLVKRVKSVEGCWALASGEAPHGPGVTHCGLRRVSGEAGETPPPPPVPTPGCAVPQGAHEASSTLSSLLGFSASSQCQPTAPNPTTFPPRPAYPVQVS